MVPGVVKLRSRSGEAQECQTNVLGPAQKSQLNSGPEPDHYIIQALLNL